MVNKKKVLIIDDEEDFCLLMQSYLSKKNCEVSVSHTLRDGLGLVYNKIPDIVFLDNNLPDGLGWHAAKNILAALPYVHLYLISANKQGNKSDYSNCNDDDRNHNKKSNTVDVLEKPISISQIDNFLK